MLWRYPAVAAPRETSAVCCVPPLWKVTLTVVPAACSRAAAVSSEASFTLRPPRSVITSPAFSPALAAADPAVTAETSAPAPAVKPDEVPEALSLAERLSWPCVAVPVAIVVASAPPEFPGLMAASVWMTSMLMEPCPALEERFDIDFAGIAQGRRNQSLGRDFDDGQVRERVRADNCPRIDPAVVGADFDGLCAAAVTALTLSELLTITGVYWVVCTLPDACVRVFHMDVASAAAPPSSTPAATIQATKTPAPTLFLSFRPVAAVASSWRPSRHTTPAVR